VRHARISANETVVSRSDDDESLAKALMCGTFVVELPTPACHFKGYNGSRRKNCFQYRAKRLRYDCEDNLGRACQLEVPSKWINEVLVAVCWL
jgi:hypothetical protein